METLPSIKDEMESAVRLGRLMLELMKLLHEEKSNPSPETSDQQSLDCSPQ